MVALLAAKNLVAMRLANLDLILTREFQGGFDRLRAAAREVDGPAAKMISGEGQQLFGIGFGDGRRELAGVNEFELRGLLDHGSGNFGHTVADEVHYRRSREVEIPLAFGVEDVDALAANRRWERLSERAAQDCGFGECGRHLRNYRVIAIPAGFKKLFTTEDTESTEESKENGEAGITDDRLAVG